MHGRNEDIGQKWTSSDLSTYVMSPGETVAHSIRALSSQLDEIQKYVDAVVRGDLTASRDVWHRTVGGIELLIEEVLQ